MYVNLKNQVFQTYLSIYFNPIYKVYKKTYVGSQITRLFLNDN